jgi:site-specific recombinase XerD
MASSRNALSLSPLTAHAPTATLAPPRARGWRVKLSKAVHEFTEGIRVMPGRSETAKTYGSSLQGLVALARPDSVLAFNHDLLERFFFDVSSAGQAMNTIYRHSTAFRQFSRWGVRRGYWTKDWMDDPQFKFKMADPMPRPYNQDQIERLMALPLDGVQKVGRALLHYAGLRVTPLCRLILSDLNFSPLIVEDVQLPGSILIARGNKGGRKQLIPMAEELYEVLLAWVSEHPAKPYDPVLRHGDGRPYTRSTVERWVKEWGRQVNVPDAIPHRFRHTNATDLLRKGVGLEVIQKLLGHASITTTQRYTRISDASLVRAILARSGKGNLLQ